MRDRFTEFWTDEAGVAFSEYALILSLVSIGLLVVLVVFRDAIGWVFDRLATALRDGAGSTQMYKSAASKGAVP